MNTTPKPAPASETQEQRTEKQKQDEAFKETKKIDNQIGKK
jgi:hypothetical protein